MRQVAGLPHIEIFLLLTPGFFFSS